MSNIEAGRSGKPLLLFCSTRKPLRRSPGESDDRHTRWRDWQDRETSTVTSSTGLGWVPCPCQPDWFLTFRAGVSGRATLCSEEDDLGRAKPLPVTHARTPADSRTSPDRHGCPGAGHAGNRRVRLHPVLRSVAHAPHVHHLCVSQAARLGYLLATR